MVKCDVRYCVFNKDGVCQQEEISLNSNRRCTSFLSEEDVEKISRGLPPTGTTTVLNCAD